MHLYIYNTPYNTPAGLRLWTSTAAGPPVTFCV